MCTTAAQIDDRAKASFFGVSFAPAAVDAAIMKNPGVASALASIASDPAAPVPKQEFHATLQFFSAPRAMSECPALASLLGAQVVATVAYVAVTPLVVAARLNIARPLAAGLACANQCPHITLALAPGAKAVWSNELLCHLEGRAAEGRDDPASAARRAAVWRAARVVTPCTSRLLRRGCSASRRQSSC